MEADSKLHDVAAVFGIGVVAPEMGNNSTIRNYYNLKIKNNVNKTGKYHTQHL